MKCILLAAALIAQSPSDFDGFTFVPRLDSGHREFLKQVTRNSRLYVERDMDRNDWDKKVTVKSIQGDVAETGIGYVLVGDLARCEETY